MDQHIHTVFSDGAHQPKDCVLAAKKLGLYEIAITDHVWRSSDWVGKYVAQIRRLQEENPQLRIRVGLEAKTVDLEGNVDISDEAAQKVDFVMGVVHRHLPDVGTDLAKLGPVRMAETEAALMLNMLKNPIVDVIGHPMRTYYKFFYMKQTTDSFPLDLMDEVAQRASQYGKILEFNSRLPRQSDLLNVLMKNGTRFTLGSDAHSADEVGDIDYDSIETSTSSLSRNSVHQNSKSI